MDKIAVLIFFIVLSVISHAKAEDHCHNAITKHLAEAITYNKSVMNRYSLLSHGESRPLSHSLIAIEKISKILVNNLDQEAELYRNHGIPLLCEELGDMKSLPNFQDSIAEELRPSYYYRFNYSSLKQKLKKLLDDNKLDEAYNILAKNLIRLEIFPNQKCLTRHFLESVARTLKLADTHRAQAKRLGLPDPIFIIKKFINIQRHALTITNTLDHKAFPLQQKGIAIYCQDIPNIDWK